MPDKRKFCDHCREFVSLRTYRLHANLHLKVASETVYSSEEEESLRDDYDDVSDFLEDRDPEMPGETNMAADKVIADEENELQGT